MNCVVVAFDQRTVSLAACDPPELRGPTSVKVRVLEVGICGTDREIARFEYGTPPAGQKQLILGHEALGQVVEVGSAVERLEPGDLVIPMVRRPCPSECFACASGRPDFCFTGEFMERGIRKLGGYMTEFIVDDERYMNRVPLALRDIGVLVEPLTIAEKALAQVWQVQQRLPWIYPATPGHPPGYEHRAVVLGGGPVGLLGAMALVSAGFQTFVYSLEPEASEKGGIVQEIGATYQSAKSLSIEQMAQTVGNIDLIYEATGASRLAFDAMPFLGTNGVFVFTGVPGRKGPVAVDTDLIMKNLVLKNQLVLGTVNADRAAFAAAIDHLQEFSQRWPRAVRALITGRFSIEAFAEPLLGAASGIKNVILCAPSMAAA